MDHGMPMVNPELCTGCGVCHAVCPAPVNAIRLLPRRPRQASANPALAT
jgi:ferredoxin